LIRDLFELQARRQDHADGRQLQLIVKASMVMAVEEFVPLLERLSGHRSSSRWRRQGVRVYLSGHYRQAAKPEVLNLIEECGATIADDDLYHGFRFVSTDIDETGDPIDALANWYLARNRRVPCAAVADEGADWDQFLLGSG